MDEALAGDCSKEWNQAADAKYDSLLQNETWDLVKQATIIMEDNQEAIYIARNPVTHARTKHIDIRYHYVREALSEGKIDLRCCPTETMVADILTKPLPKARLEMLHGIMGLEKWYLCQLIN